MDNIEREPGADVPIAESLVDSGVPGSAETGPGVAELAETPPAQDFDTLTRERDELYDRLLRKTAEFDNFRKRTERERQERSELAAADLIRDLLPLVDNLERALKVAADDSGAEAYRRGVELIRKQLLDLLAGRGVAVIDPVGAQFDPHWHEAVAREAAPDRVDGEVLEVFSRGYRIGDRLLRPAMVKVASA
jgi:molecular chaperone GrpE